MKLEILGVKEESWNMMLAFWIISNKTYLLTQFRSESFSILFNTNVRVKLELDTVNFIVLNKNKITILTSMKSKYSLSKYRMQAF